MTSKAVYEAIERDADNAPEPSPEDEINDPEAETRRKLQEREKQQELKELDHWTEVRP